eukprot:CAMPEP_0196249348 /NCGR_PEP_ID=MMETSP0913-20130531/42668_1 /TAXON_ID=49265 /ORGANISM="Thalassiosira rotula, Strain GSO102" /LENGTH=73 /DNA_ID=CAMNT_0041534915 /DNA_START=88 /DNA_END=309 /DNA_ORIENTATION=+
MIFVRNLAMLYKNTLRALFPVLISFIKDEPVDPKNTSLSSIKRSMPFLDIFAQENRVWIWDTASSSIVAISGP